MTYQAAEWRETPHRAFSWLSLEVDDGRGRLLGRVYPEESFFRTSPRPGRRMAVLASLRGELCAVHEGVLEGDRARVALLWNPLAGFVWLGGMVMLLGAVLAALAGRDALDGRGAGEEGEDSGDGP